MGPRARGYGSTVPPAFVVIASPTQVGVAISIAPAAIATFSHTASLAMTVTSDNFRRGHGVQSRQPSTLPMQPDLISFDHGAFR
jgi:hypothetical protein